MQLGKLNLELRNQQHGVLLVWLQMPLGMLLLEVSSLPMKLLLVVPTMLLGMPNHERRKHNSKLLRDAPKMLQGMLPPQLALPLNKLLLGDRVMQHVSDKLDKLVKFRKENI